MTYVLNRYGDRLAVEPSEGGTIVPHAHISNPTLPLPIGASTDATLLAILARLAPKALTATRTTKTVTTATSTILVLNAARVGASLLNLGTVLYVGLGIATSETSYTAKLGANDVWIVPAGYAGIVTAVRGSGSAAVVVTEWI